MTHAIPPLVGALGLTASLGFAAVGQVIAATVIATLVRESRQTGPPSDNGIDDSETRTEHSGGESV